MADVERKLAAGKDRIDFHTDPARYRHWKLAVDGEVATLLMDVDENAPLFEGYQLKLNSYDLGVDIELADALERLRFEHPEVRVVLLRSGKPTRVLRRRQHPHAGGRDATPTRSTSASSPTRPATPSRTPASISGQRMICVVTGSCAGGGYELALAADHIILMDDGSSTVSLPELPLLAVLPGTGGLTRVTDKRKVRRDHADVFCTTEEGVKGKRAVEWRLVDEVVPNSRLDEAVSSAREGVRGEVRPADGRARHRAHAARAQARADGVEYEHVSVEIDARQPARHHHAARPGQRRRRPMPTRWSTQGAAFWPLQLARELDDAILDIRLNEFEIAVIVFKSEGDPQARARL